MLGGVSPATSSMPPKQRMTRRKAAALPAEETEKVEEASTPRCLPSPLSGPKATKKRGGGPEVETPAEGEERPADQRKMERAEQHKFHAWLQYRPALKRSYASLAVKDKQGVSAMWLVDKEGAQMRLTQTLSGEKRQERTRTVCWLTAKKVASTEGFELGDPKLLKLLGSLERRPSRHAVLADDPEMDEFLFEQESFEADTQIISKRTDSVTMADVDEEDSTFADRALSGGVASSSAAAAKPRAKAKARRKALQDKPEKKEKGKKFQKLDTKLRQEDGTTVLALASV